MTVQSNHSAHNILVTFGPRSRRTNNFWEPIFDPAEENEFPLCNWDFGKEKNATHMTLRLEELKRVAPIFKKINFYNCDFYGDFDLSPREIVFTDCVFENCDFGLSSWKRAKFNKCTFKRTSFTQVQLHSCNFANCIWIEIGISGTETEIINTVINNPSDFINAGYTNTDPKTLEAKKVLRIYQLMRLEKSKSKLARQLARDFLNFGDEKSYYEAVRTSTIQELQAKFCEYRLQLKIGETKWIKFLGIVGLIMTALEAAILNIFGLVNSWGASIARPAFIGSVIVVVFATAYVALGISCNFSVALIKSIEITLLVGYTNHSSSSLPIEERWIALINMVVGLLWYVVIIPTLVNRVSRVR